MTRHRRVWQWQAVIERDFGKEAAIKRGSESRGNQIITHHMVPILITRLRANEDPKILERHKELISRDSGINIDNGTNILILGRVRGKEEL